MILENFLPEPYARELYDELTSSSFTWNYSDRTIKDSSILECVNMHRHSDSAYFQHVVWNDKTKSNRFELFKPMLYFFEYRTGYIIKNVIRIVSNLMVPSEAPIFGIPHLDTKSNVPDKVKTLLYYVNDSDGPTTLYNERYNSQRIESLSELERYDPAFNKAILFESDRYHCSCTPTKSNRIVINFVIEIQ